MKKLLAVDGNSILNRAFYGVRPLSNREGFPTNALFGMVSILLKNLEAVNPDYCAIAFDLKAPTFRHKMYPEYKAGRHPTPEDLLRQMPLAKETAAALGFRCLETEGYEADDILGTLSAFAEENDAVAYLLTGDRDALQLISDRTHILLCTNTETVDFDRNLFFEKYGVEPTQFVDVKALMGDSSDHIPGVPGIGEKTALSLISAHGSLDGVYSDLPEAKLTPSVRNKLESGKDSAYFSQKLSAICREVPLSCKLEELAYNGPNRKKLFSLFSQFDFQVFIRRLGLNGTETAASSDTKVPIRPMGINEVEILHSPAAIDVFEGHVFVFDGESFFETEDTDVIHALLSKKDLSIVCYDAKRMYQQLELMKIHFRECSFDVMLAAYVLDATGNFELSSLSLSYLETTLPDAPYHLKNVLDLFGVLSKKINEIDAGKLLFDIEMPLAAVLCDMELSGFRVDRDGLVAYGSQLTAGANDLAERIYFQAGGEFNINSPKQLGEVLFEKQGLPHGKKTKTGYSTNAEVLEKLRPYSSIVDDILNYRQLTKLNSTYAEGLVRQIGADGRIHTVFKQCGTATGRLSSAEPNLQNIPIRTELGKELRRYFVPENNNYCLIDADYSQIELRLLASLAQDGAMIAAFESGTDIHTSTAASVFGVPVYAVTPELRKRAKAVNFGILYGMGAHSLSEDLHIPLSKAKSYIESYFAAYPGINEYLSTVVAAAYETGYVATLFGRRRYIPELKMKNRNLQHFGERVAMNSPIQGTAADIIKTAMIRVARKLKESGLNARLILQVHDELIVESSLADAERAQEILVFEMEHAANLAVPLKVSVAQGKNWLDSH